MFRDLWRQLKSRYGVCDRTIAYLRVSPNAPFNLRARNTSSNSNRRSGSSISSPHSSRICRSR